MRTAVRDTSIDAFRSLPNDYFKGQDDRIEAIVRSSKAPMSMQEIYKAYKARFGNVIEYTSISRSINSLVTAKRLDRLEGTRKCTVSGKSIHPVCVPVSQGRLFQ